MACADAWGTHSDTTTQADGESFNDAASASLNFFCRHDNRKITATATVSSFLFVGLTFSFFDHVQFLLFVALLEDLKKKKKKKVHKRLFILFYLIFSPL